jgi:hypothetical protein
MAPDRVRTNTREKPALFVIATVVVALFEELLSQVMVHAFGIL